MATEVFHTHCCELRTKASHIDIEYAELIATIRTIAHDMAILSSNNKISVPNFDEMISRFDASRSRLADIIATMDVIIACDTN